jgi:NADPH:quinone reductase
VKAVRLHHFGTPDVLTYEDAPTPQPAEGEVLVRVRAAGINPVDWKTRQGKGVAGVLGAPPLVLGWDLAGEVVAVGAGVTTFAPGDAVYGMPRFPAQAAAYAEYVAAPATQLAHKPASLDFVQAAAVPLAALTAWQALIDIAGLQAGQTVLVHAAAGGVGHLAVQLAKWRGAKVIGTASARNHEFVRLLGADTVIDYTSTPFEEQLRDIDLVLDTISGETRARSWPTLRPGGLLIALTGGLAPEEVPVGLRATRMLVAPNAVQLRELAALFDAARLQVVVDRVLPLAAAAQAHTYGEQGHARGKIVLQVP